MIINVPDYYSNLCAVCKEKFLLFFVSARFIIRLCKGRRPTHSLIFLSKLTQKEGESVGKRYKAITFDDRKTIASMYGAGAVAVEIAEKVGVSRTSIYAELKRGQDGVTLDKNFRPAYDPALARCV